MAYISIKEVARKNEFDVEKLKGVIKNSISTYGDFSNLILEEDEEKAKMLYLQKYSSVHEEAQRLKKEAEEARRETEKRKADYAKSFNEFYEYDVVTIINQDHGCIDKERMMRVLSSHASQGWRLHSVYSNELGKNAIRLLGFGTNSTACEDVLIFERRVESL